jgi:hypothetical protein
MEIYTIGILAFFLRELCSIEYKHNIELAPSKDLFEALKGGKITWRSYQRALPSAASR